MRRMVGLVGFALVFAVFAAGCQGSPARLRSPTLTPILLPRVTEPPPASPVLPRSSRVANPAATTARPTTTPPTTPTRTARPTSLPSPSSTPAVTPSRSVATAAKVARSTAAPRRAGKIAFQEATGGNIYLLDAGRGGPQRLTDGLDPALSPDGTRLAFARWGDAPGIYVLDLSTRQERQVAGADQPRSPTWSSNGETIAFAHLLERYSCRETPFGCLSGDEVKSFFRGQDCISTSFGKVCVSDFPLVSRERYGLAQVGAAGGEWLDLPTGPDAQTPVWRPASDDILFLGDGRLQITGRDRTPRPLASEAWTVSPAWSPDGSRIVAQRRLHDRWELVLLDSQGTTLKYLTSDAGNNVAATWSPDGKSILFLSDRDGSWRFYSVNADGSGQALFRPDALKDLDIRYDYASERVASWVH